MDTGPGTLKTLHITAFAKDGVTPLSGTGTLFVMHWKRVSTTPGNSTTLTWNPNPNDFEFIDDRVERVFAHAKQWSDHDHHRPSYTNANAESNTGGYYVS